MTFCCDLEVDVNGEETFMVNKKIMSAYTGRFRKLFGKSRGGTKNLKVIFNDFPGGPESFELVTRFCYNGGNIRITPSNLLILHYAAEFMEMNGSISSSPNLLELTEKFLQEINYWTWSELLVALKQCRDLLPSLNCCGVLDKYMDCLTGRMALSGESSSCPSSSSPDSSGIRVSFDSRSTESLKTSSSSQMTWWFDDLLFLNTNLLEMVTKSMVSRKFDHVVISKFLLYYQKSKYFTITSDEKRKVIETVVNLLYVLDWKSVSCKSLFGILRVTLSLNINKCSRNKLEDIIGSQLDQASLDNLLVPPPRGTNYLYDVNLVLRFLKVFAFGRKYPVSSMQMQKVARLVDLYLAEVAPDPSLKPSKFIALTMALPDSARDSYEDIYHSIDMYLQAHLGLSEKEKMKICCGINYEKLSAETCIHLSQNRRFPSKSTVQALLSQQVKLKSLLKTNSNSSNGSPRSSTEAGNENETSKQITHYAGDIDILTDNVNFRAHLQGMQSRVAELENVCREMQAQMSRIMKTKMSSQRSLPKLCS